MRSVLHSKKTVPRHRENVDLFGHFYAADGHTVHILTGLQTSVLGSRKDMRL